MTTWKIITTRNSESGTFTAELQGADVRNVSNKKSRAEEMVERRAREQRIVLPHEKVVKVSGGKGGR